MKARMDRILAENSKEISTNTSKGKFSKEKRDGKKETEAPVFYENDCKSKGIKEVSASLTADTSRFL